MSEQSKEDLCCMAEGLAYGLRWAKKKKKKVEKCLTLRGIIVHLCVPVCECVCVCVAGLLEQFQNAEMSAVMYSSYLTLFRAFEGFQGLICPKK